uniref:Putative secreted peptide n=1 Tax=Anopheles braziliensis TaxID=58242 RepID=A0A2M3ZV56_9DIPT
MMASAIAIFSAVVPRNAITADCAWAGSLDAQRSWRTVSLSVSFATRFISEKSSDGRLSPRSISANTRCNLRC